MSNSDDTHNIKIYVASNGVHTDFVLPVESEIMDWKMIFPDPKFKKYWGYAPYIAFGWGDRGFYLNTPEWKDLRPPVAIRALLLPSVSAMHVTLWPEPSESELTRAVTIDSETYQKIIEYILNSFRMTTDEKPVVIDHPGYGDFDLFYESSLSFHLFRTCNSWTCRGLKQAGIRTSIWTLYDKPILFHLSRIDSAH